MSAPATSFDALIDRIEEVLAEGKGDARELAAADRFDFVHWIDRLADEASVASHQHKTAFAWIMSADTMDGHSSICRNAKYEITVRLEMAYYMGTRLRHAELKSISKTMANDMHKVTAALEWNANLQQTEAAAPTGLAGNALTLVSWSQASFHPEQSLILAHGDFLGRVIVTNPA